MISRDVRWWWRRIIKKRNANEKESFFVELKTNFIVAGITSRVLFVENPSWQTRHRSMKI
jgi:hypothetical protein